MWLTGDDIGDEEGKLKEVSMDTVFARIRQPEDGLQNEVERLRATWNLTHRISNKEPLHLPFIMTCRLNTFRRCTGEFSEIEDFCVDVTSLPKEESALQQFRQEIQNDRYVTMVYLSARGDRLHVFFHLRVPCRSQKKFAVFYRVFGTRFLKEHNLKEELDNTATSPLRAIALSYDPNIFYRRGGAPVVMEQFERGEEANVMFEREQQHREMAQQQKAEKKEQRLETAGKEPTSRELQIIKGILKRGIGEMKALQQVKVKGFQTEFDENKRQLTSRLEDNGLRLQEMTVKGSLRKLKVDKEGRTATVNVVFGETNWSVSGVPMDQKDRLWFDTLKQIVDNYVKEMVYKL